MPENKNIDPLEALLAKQKAAMEGKSVEEVESVSFADEAVDPSPEDIYGDNDLAEDIANEEAEEKANRAAMAAEMAEAKKQRESEAVFMPPDEHDMKYHEEAIGFQTDKLSVVTSMVNKVVAKYRIISGGIPEALTNEQRQMGLLTRMNVMGELIDIYHRNGEKITAEFESMILSNWVMPDGTLAINNINENGIVIDKLMMNTPSNNIPNNNTSEAAPTQEASAEEKKPDAPQINITVEKNTPVTVNVDKELVADIEKTNEVNIFVKEVTDKDMLATTVVENSNREGIINPYDSGINDVPLTLPLSAYRCVMRSINWFDFIKLTAPTSNNGSDNELKKWSVIYDHLKNPSIGEFDSFEDFLKKTKYQDRELLMWGLLVATADEEETLSITCGNPKCKNNIKIKYHPRTIQHIDNKKTPKWFEAADAAVGPEAISVWETACNMRKRYKLPNTGIIAEINEPSAHDFITKKLPLINDLYKRYKPDDELANVNVNDVSMAEFDYLSANALFVSAMTIVRTEKGKPKEYRFTNWEDIEEIITKALDAEDSGILLKIIEKTRANVSPVSFYLENIDCPVCGRHEDRIPINEIGNTLLFQVSRRLSNTEINLIEMD
jgi:hypothetical protein